jgi:hypothetical protein
MPKVFIGLDQGLTKAGEEVVGTMNTVRCNHCSRYMSWARSSLTKGNRMSYILRRLVPSCTLLCVYRAAEQTEQQSNRAGCSRAACRSHDLCSVVTWQPALGWLHCLYLWYSGVSGRYHTHPWQKLGVSRVLGLPAKLIYIPKVFIRGYRVLTVIVIVSFYRPLRLLGIYVIPLYRLVNIE